MMKPREHRPVNRVFAVMMIGPLLAASWCASVRGQATEEAAADGAARVGLLVYGTEQKTGRCFSEDFLELLALETTVRVSRSFEPVALDSTELAGFPFVVMSGEGSFQLTSAEQAALRAYLQRGGFVLASAGCSNHAWAVSFERAMSQAMPEAPLRELTLQHPVFSTAFDVTELASRRRQPVRMLGVQVGERLAVLYSPQGLNDTRNIGAAAAGECCCCGGDEIVGARAINANALVYTLLNEPGDGGGTVAPPSDQPAEPSPSSTQR
jgi:hypothetical protein